MGNQSRAVPVEPTHDIYHYTGNPLDKIFAPKSVALVGATENTAPWAAPFCGI